MIFAGNESDVRTITIHKDTTPPDTARISFKSNTINSITVEAIGNDNTSGVSGYTFEYREISAPSTDWKTLANGRITTTAGRVTYTLTWSTNSNLSSAQTSTASGNSGAEVTFAAKTGLGNYTTYYWKVTVTDGYGGSVSSSVQNTRTWCKTTQCDGSYSTQR